ncbi:MAG: penicillin-binding protein 2 [Oligoflexia bacterium]|nr:penicillin-binding protein 2 [Oligoflexia bacterium]
MSPFDLVESSEDVKEYQNRYTYLYGTVILALVILFLRLWYLQIFKGTELLKFSEQNQIKEEKINAPRGMMLDRNGEILVDSLPSFNVTLTPQYIENTDDIATELASTLNIKKEDIIKKVKQSRRQNGVFKPVRIKEDINRDEVGKIERMIIDNPGLKVEMVIKRNYLLDKSGSQLFGYVSEVSKEELPQLNAKRKFEFKLKSGDIIGKAGLEKRWDFELRGVDGARFVEVDARGREIASGKDLILGGYPEGADYVPGHNITLTIDKDIQQAAYDSFIKNKHTGSVVVLDPNTGEILSMVNTPSYDPNYFSTGISPEIWSQLVNDPFKPLRNKAVQDHYAPGSTFKTIVAIAALEEKLITTKTTFSCPGYMNFGRRKYNCWRKHGHGPVNVYQALERSCDVFFYHLGIDLGIDKIAKYARKLGLGSKTGIELDNERTGLVPDTEWKKKALGEEWQPGENLSNAIGQGFNLLSPLQMATSYAAIATNGKVFRPYLIKKIESIDSKVLKVTSPHLIHNAQKKENENDVTISHETFQIVKQALVDVFEKEHGTARGYKIPGLHIAGKTGTVQLFQLTAETVFAKCENKPLKHRHHGWMAAFAPAENPLIAMAVHIEHGCHGTAAGPTIRDITLAYFKKYAPDMIKNLNVKVKEIVTPQEEE